MPRATLLDNAINRAVPYLPPRVRLALLYYRFHRRWPHLRRPRTFTEKVQHRKLYDRDPRLPRLADKVLVKDYVANVLGDDWVIPTLWAGPGLPPREDRRWPLPYVIKANHGCEWNIFVRSQKDEDWARIEETVALWLNRPYARYSVEWLYAQIEPQLLVEPLIGGAEGLPFDYKFFVFGGRAHYIQMDTGRGVDHRRAFFDREWVRQPFAFKAPPEDRALERPVSFERMLAASELLAGDLPFVRVDFYECEGKPLFGEMTFYPTSGFGVFTPASWDLRFGQLWP